MRVPDNKRESFCIYIYTVARINHTNASTIETRDEINMEKNEKKTRTETFFATTELGERFLLLLLFFYFYAVYYGPRN